MILCAVSPGERRVAVWQGGLLAARIERPARPEGVDDVHIARVTAVAKPLSGCFLATVDGEAFLPFSELPERRPPAEGTLLRVRITRAAQGGKGARAALAPGEASGPVRRLARGPEALARFAARWPDAPVLLDDAAEAARWRGLLGERVRAVPRAFDEAVEEAFAALAEPAVALPGGGTLWIRPTPALVAMDVDSGGAALRETNAAAMREAARQIALRELSGAILIDAAGLRPREREALLAPLAAALDPAAKLLGLTPGGLIELRRARVWAPWHEQAATPLGRGLALLRVAAREAAARPGARPVVVAPREVIAALEALPEALAEYAARAGAPAVLRVAEPAVERVEPG